ncbi:MAG: hypothetical protein J6X61_06650 [Clostridia bacterium]|nr:hypothetical protein [Clostridia bacterium]
MLVKMTCPSCGATLEMDDGKEFMFCEFCGTKIANVTEKVDVTLSGSVAIDESGKLENFHYVVQTALKSGNYGEAYTYCLRILETAPLDLRANLYKGLSAVMQSTPGGNRTAEGVTAVKAMISAGKFASENADAVRAFVDYVAGMIPVLYDAQCAVKGRQPLGSGQDADNLFHLAFGIVTYVTAVVEALNVDLLRVAPALEEGKRGLILLGLKLADRATTPVPYVSGFVTKTDRNGRTVNEPQTVKAKCPHARDLQECTLTLKKENNALPTTVSEIARLDGELAQRKQVITAYETALAAYFTAHPEQEKPYRHPGLFGREKRRAAIEANFPAELLSQKALSVQAAEEAHQLEGQKKRFVKEHIM